MQTHRSNAGALIAGSILIGFGLLSLIGRVFQNLDWGLLWSLAILGFGALFFIAMFAGGKSAAAFAIPGSIIGGIGLMLLFQNLTRHWASISYFWTLIIMFVGTGIAIMGWYGEDSNQRNAGLRVLKIGFILFLIFGTITEMMTSSLGNMVFPIVLIALGAYLVLSRSGLFRNQENSADHPLPPTS